MWLTVYPCYWSYLFWFPFNKASTSHSHSAFQSKQRIVSFIIGFLVKNTTTCCLPSQLHVQIIAFKKCKEFLAIDGKKTSNCLLTKSNALSVSSVWYICYFTALWLLVDLLWVFVHLVDLQSGTLLVYQFFCSLWHNPYKYHWDKFHSMKIG